MYRILKIATALLFLLLFSCEKKKEEKKENTNQKEIAVEYSTSTYTKISETIKNNGLTKPSRTTTVMVKAAGDVTAFNLTTGQKVKKGQSVITILSRRQWAQLEYAKVQLEEAKLAYEATGKLYEKGKVSKAEYLNSKSQYTGAMGQVMANKIAYRDCFVKFSFGGIINWYDETIHKGSIVQPGTPICEVIDLSNIKVSLFFGEEKIVKMSIGDSTTVTIPVLSQSFPGKIIAISPAASEKTGSFKVDIEFKNSESLAVKSGMRSEVTIFTGNRFSGYEIPKRFIREYRGEKGVYVAIKKSKDNDSLISSFKPLSYFSKGSDKAFVTKGITELDKIITSGFSRLKDKTPVKITKSENGE